LSPETAANNQFKPVMDDIRFRSKIYFIAIDEMHLVKKWDGGEKGFHPEYG